MTTVRYSFAMLPCPQGRALWRHVLGIRVLVVSLTTFTLTARQLVQLCVGERQLRIIGWQLDLTL